MSILNKKENKNEEILNCLSKLEPVEFLGVSQMLNVEIFKDKEMKEPKDFWEILPNLLEKIEKLNRKQHRNLLKILRAATSKKEDKK